MPTNKTKGAAAPSSLRRQKQESRAAYWRKLTPEKRLRRAAEMTAAGRKLRAAGLAALGLASLIGDASPRTRGR